MARCNCGHHECDRVCQINHHFCTRCIIYTLIVLISTIFSVAIVNLWIILHPTKPEFILQNATLSPFNLTQPNILTTTLQVTISTQNPNDNIGIYYERSNMYASYRNQQITTPSLSLPPTYLGYNATVTLSTNLFGDHIPIDMNMAMLLQQDENGGIVLINVKIDGLIKWEFGNWIYRKHPLHVNCHAYVTYDDSSDNYHLPSKCDVDV